MDGFERVVVPSGWQICNYDQDVRLLCTKFPWGSGVLVLNDGSGIFTLACSTDAGNPGDRPFCASLAVKVVTHCSGDNFGAYLLDKTYTKEGLPFFQCHLKNYDVLIQRRGSLASTAPVAAPRPSAAASLLDDLFTSAPASAPAVHHQHQQPAQAWGAPAPVSAPIATKPATGANDDYDLDDLFNTVAPIAQVPCHNRGLPFLSHFLLARMFPFSLCFVSISPCNFSFAVLRNESWGVPSPAAATAAAVASATAWFSRAAKLSCAAI